MTNLPPWDSPSFDLEPWALHTGPFVRRAFLRSWWEHFGTGERIHILDDGATLIPLRHTGYELSFMGEPDLTDYHSPLGSEATELLTDFLRGPEAPDQVHFDSMPIEAATPLSKGLQNAGYQGGPVPHHSTSVLALPNEYEEWLSGLERKQRHEIRRKTRRFEESIGSIRLERHQGLSAVQDFVTLHRKSPGRKGLFMTDIMEAFFESLASQEAAVVDLLYERDEPIAAAFGFEEPDVYYLYNSAYDPERRHLSPGIVLVTSLVQQAIRSEKKSIDFLKGDERYKTRFGASPRILYEIRATQKTTA